MPKKVNASKAKVTNNKSRGKGKRTNVRKNARNSSKSCPVGKVCFGFQLNVRHIALILLLIVVVLLIILFYKHHKDNNDNSTNLLSNFQNLGKKIQNNPKNKINTYEENNKNNVVANNVETNNVGKNKTDEEKPNITINYHVNAETKNNVPEMLDNQMPIPPINTSTFLINKDYERVINPLEPPER